jgi:hypothetical protein
VPGINARLQSASRARTSGLVKANKIHVSPNARTGQKHVGTLAANGGIKVCDVFLQGNHFHEHVIKRDHLDFTVWPVTRGVCTVTAACTVKSTPYV